MAEAGNNFVCPCPWDCDGGESTDGTVGITDFLTLLAQWDGPGNGSEVDPYCSIQTAIDNAVDTDEIVVAPGTYVEAINFLGKAITLRSSDGQSVTTIDGTGFSHVV